MFSEEGTTEGDPLAMPMYAVATTPLINSLSSGVQQVWYADDATAMGKIGDLRDWWDRVLTKGSAFGYHANAAKSWIMVKEKHYHSAVAAFAHTDVNVTCDGSRPIWEQLLTLMSILRIM